jgi:hypothetical protein
VDAGAKASPKMVCRVRRAPCVSDEQATQNFANFCALLVRLRRMDEAAGDVYLDDSGDPLPPLGNPNKSEDSPL